MTLAVDEVAQTLVAVLAGVGQGRVEQDDVHGPLPADEFEVAVGGQQVPESDGDDLAVVHERNAGGASQQWHAVAGTPGIRQGDRLWHVTSRVHHEGAHSHLGPENMPLARSLTDPIRESPQNTGRPPVTPNTVPDT